MEKYAFKTDRVGKIEVKEIFFFFQEPMVFSATDTSGNIYLMNRIGVNEYAVVLIPELKLYYSKIRKVQAQVFFAQPEGETYLLSGELNGKEASMELRRFKADEILYPGVCLTNWLCMKVVLKMEYFRKIWYNIII